MKISETIIFCAVLAALSSCKKDVKPGQTNDKKEYEITFNVKGFTQEYAGIRTAATGDTVILEDRDFRTFRAVYWEIFNSAGIVPLNFRSNTNGTLVAKLQPGNYKIICVGATVDDTKGLDRNEDDYAVSGNLYHWGPITSFYYDMERGYASFRETFAKTMTFTVGATNPVHSITLERLVAQVQLNIKDAIPNNVAKIQFSIDSTSHVVDFGTEPFNELGEDWEGAGNGGVFTIGSTLKGKRNLRFGIYALVEPNSKHDATIYALDANNAIVASKKVYDVTCSPNQITILSGNLFGGAGTTTGTSIKAEAGWNSNVIHKSF